LVEKLNAKFESEIEQEKFPKTFVISLFENHLFKVLDVLHSSLDQVFGTCSLYFGS
jgi:hypothetical protein